MLIDAKRKSLQSSIYARLESQPDGRGFAFSDNTGNFSWITFEDFYKQATGYAATLSEFGLGKSDVCLLVLSSDEFCATLLFSTLLLGAIPLLIAPPTLQSGGAFSSLNQIIRHVVRKTSPKILVLPDGMESLRDVLSIGRNTPLKLLGERQLSPDHSATIPPHISNEYDWGAMQLTSGTTGVPRVCVWKHRNIIEALEGMTSAMKLSLDDICMNWTPLYHDMGLVNNFFLCLANGLPLVMLNPVDFVRNPALWLRVVSDTDSTITWSPNFGFALATQRIQNSEIDGIQLAGVRSFWNAAERIHIETMLAFHERFSPYGVRLGALQSNFGCAENIGGATFSDPDGKPIVEHVDTAALHEKLIARKVSSTSDEKHISIVGVGKPYPGMTIKILSRNGRVLPDGRVGEIALETPSRMECYLKDKRATDRTIKGNLLRTGDLGYLREGELFWVGRTRERINVRGVKFDPSDFEQILLKVPGLRHGNFAAFGIDDHAKGTQNIVIVSEVRDSSTLGSDELRNEIRNLVFESFGVNVSDVLLVKRGTLTKTSSGKRRHGLFKHLYSQGELTDLEWKQQVNGTSS